MKLLDAILPFAFFFPVRGRTSPSATNYAWLLSRALLPSPSPQQLGQLIHVGTAHLRASCRSSTAALPPPFTQHLTLHHSLFSLRICISCFLKVHFQTATEQVDPAEDNPVNVHRGTPDWVLHTEAMASQTKHPAPNKGM